jgi:hypothetical protein
MSQDKREVVKRESASGAEARVSTNLANADSVILALAFWPWPDSQDALAARYMRPAICGREPT